MAPVMTPRLQRMISELSSAGERYLRIVYIETDVLHARPPRERHLPLLEAARAGSSRAVRKALSEHLQSNEREIVASLRSIIGESAVG
jgi:DNA-binding GntR family transcriptional regulator